MDQLKTAVSKGFSIQSLSPHLQEYIKLYTTILTSPTSNHVDHTEHHGLKPLQRDKSKFKCLASELVQIQFTYAYLNELCSKHWKNEDGSITLFLEWDDNQRKYVGKINDRPIDYEVDLNDHCANFHVGETFYQLKFEAGGHAILQSDRKPQKQIIRLKPTIDPPTWIHPWLLALWTEIEVYSELCFNGGEKTFDIKKMNESPYKGLLSYCPVFSCCKYSLSRHYSTRNVLSPKQSVSNLHKCGNHSCLCYFFSQ